MAVAITRMELDAAGLREAATRSKDAAASRRMLALTLVLEGSNRTQAARGAHHEAGARPVGCGLLNAG